MQRLFLGLSTLLMVVLLCVNVSADVTGAGSTTNTQCRLEFISSGNLTGGSGNAGAGAAGDLANNDELFNIHPLKVILSFER